MANLTKCEAATAIIVCAASVVVLATGIAHDDIGLKMAPSVWESLFKIAALIGAGVFFAFKACGGYNNLNLAVYPTSERMSKSSTEDFLSIHIVLEKGAAAAFSLEGVEVQLTSGGVPLSRKNLQVRRLPISEQGVIWSQEPSDRGHSEPLYVSPGDKLQLACFETVPSGEPCLIEILVFGRKRRRDAFLAQWRGTAVSLPIATAHLSPS